MLCNRHIIDISIQNGGQQINRFYIYNTFRFEFFDSVYKIIIRIYQEYNICILTLVLGSVYFTNIDRFAASGLLFQNAYCNIPVSGASRASLLTGVYPHYPDRFVNYSAYASKDCPTAIPISRWFTSHGYYTISNGKVFHHLSDHANSWSNAPAARVYIILSRQYICQCHSLKSINSIIRMLFHLSFSFLPQFFKKVFHQRTAFFFQHAYFQFYLMVEFFHLQ